MDQINRYNMYSTAAVTCNVAPGSSSGEGIRQMESLIKSQLGDEFGYEWTSVAYQETQAGTTTTVVFVMALLVAFLVLAAQYESWTSPVAAVMGLPVALLGAMLGCYVMGTPVSIYTQIGIILLVALSAEKRYSDCGVCPRLPCRGVTLSVSRHLKPDTSGCVLS